MNKKTAAIIAAVVLVLAIVGVVVALNMNKNKDNQANNSDNNSSEQSNQSSTDSFNPTDPSTLSYVATSTTTVSGQTVTGTIESDGKGTQKVSNTVAGMTTESYIKGNDVTVCMNGSCTKQTVDATSTDAANQAAANAAQYRDTATKVGTEACGSDTCQVWTATGSIGEIKYWIDSKNRVSKLTVGGNEIVYDYKDVSITIPNA